uniref:Putative secreted protein n=1 Tax=Panstrongylus lignarius TaxID=156445 RepID=A0A224XV04_9HEMI
MYLFSVSIDALLSLYFVSNSDFVFKSSSFSCLKSETSISFSVNLNSSCFALALYLSISDFNKASTSA